MGKKVKESHFVQLPRKQTVSAVQQIRSQIKSKRDPTNLLQSTNELVYLQIELNSVPEIPTLRAIPIHIPHTLYSKKFQSSVCLITKDPQREWKELLDRLQMTDTPISKVIGIDKLGKNYGQFKLRRQLIKDYDLFLADVRVFNMLPDRLGKYFYAKKKIPALIDLTQDPKASITNAIHSTYFVSQKGPCFMVKVGRVPMSSKQIADNIQAVLDALPDVLPPILPNHVRRLEIKGDKTLALPFYHHLTKEEKEAVKQFNR